MDNDIEQVMVRARQAFKSGITRDIGARKRNLQNLLQFYRENEQELLECLHKDLGKHYSEGIVTELDYLIHDCQLVISRIDQWTRPVKVGRSLCTLFDRPAIYAEPYGVVLVMGAWNYPLQLTLLPVAAAIAAGNCVVIKPSDQSAATAEFLRLRLSRYLPATCFPVVCGGADRCRHLLQQRFDYIMYTGCGSVAREVMSAAARHLTPVTLELGGKCPVYMDASVNMQYAVRRILWGKLINLGQTCIAPDYLICDQQTERLFIDVASVVLRDWFGMTPAQSSCLGRIVNKKHFNRLRALLKNSRGYIEVGGGCDHEQLFIEPTIVSGVELEDSLMSEELFGPILPIVRANSPQHAVSIINQIGWCTLCVYVFSSRQSVGAHIQAETHSGSLLCNDVIVQAIVDQLPFGGVGSSGMGRYHGKASFDTFTNYKSVLHRTFNPVVEAIASVRYPPYTDAKLYISRLLLKNPALPSLTGFKYLLTFCVGIASVHLATLLTQMYHSEQKTVDNFLQ